MSVATPQGKQAEGELLEKGTVCTSAEKREAETREGYDKEVNKIKMRKQVSMMYSKSIDWV